MNIFIVSRGYPEPNDPQWGIFEAEQAEALRKIGHKVTIIAVDGRLRFYPRKIGIKHLKEEGAYIFHLFPFKLLSFSSRLVTKVNQWMMRRLFTSVSDKEGMPDIVYAHYLNNMQNCLAIRPVFKGGMVGLEHWSELIKPDLNPAVRETAKKVYPEFDKILSVSPYLSNALKENYKIDSVFVPNIVSDRFFEKDRKETNREIFEFCAIGRLVSLKNFDLLIKAAHKLKEQSVNFRLRIIGSGPEHKKLSNLISDLSLADRVTLTGQLKREEIIEILSESHSLILPSSYETFGVVLIEALAMGIPIIATKSGGPEYIVNDTNGILIPPDDPDAITNAMNRMIENYPHFNSQKISSECEALYSGENIAKKLETIFKNVLEDKTPFNKIC